MKGMLIKMFVFAVVLFGSFFVVNKLPKMVRWNSITDNKYVAGFIRVLPHPTRVGF